MKSILHFTKWVLVWTSTLSMLMSPLAVAQSNLKVSRAQMQQAINDLGLNRQITMGEFYARNKHLLPPRIAKQLAPMFERNKNIRMPVFEVSVAKNTRGEEIPNVRISAANGELINIQWLGEQDRLMKFQNIHLSEADVVNFDDMFFRIAASDEKYRKQAPYFSQQANKPTTRAEKWKNFRYVLYPSASVMEWKSMTPFQRANYVVTFRQLWQDAREVLKQKEIRDRAKSKNKKTSQLQLPASTEDFFALLHTLNVTAAQASDDGSGLLGGPDGDTAAGSSGGSSGTEGRSGRPMSVAQRSGVFTGETCIVAGYVSNYVNNSCTVQTIDNDYNNSNNTLYQRARAVCTERYPGTIACNPYVYGAPGGEPICVTPSRSNQQFQRATAWDGPCDDGSQLSTNRQGSIGQTAAHRGRYANLMSDEERRRTFGQAQRVEGGTSNFALTEQYLYGVMRLRGLIAADASSDMTLNLANRDNAEDILRQIAKDRDTFEREIGLATQSCQAEASTSNDNPRVERNYWDACDQLHRRFLMVNELFAEKCGGADKLDTATLKCRCEGSTATVIPGAQCTAAAAHAGPATQASGGSQPNEPAAASAVDCDSQLPGSSLVGGRCVCPGGAAPVTDSTSGAAQCGPAVGSPPSQAPGNDCNFMCRIGRFLRGAIPWVVAGVAAYFLFKMLAPKKPALQAPADRCANGTVPPCVQQCPVPFVPQSGGSCGCAACPPQQSPDATTCVCSTQTTGGTGGSTTNPYTCPDMSIVTGSSESEALAKCPTYPCWDGQTYQNPMNCPPPPATTTTAPAPLPAPSGTR